MTELTVVVEIGETMILLPSLGNEEFNLLMITLETEEAAPNRVTGTNN